MKDASAALTSVLKAVYQPVIATVSRQVLYYEALARSARGRNHEELLKFAEGYGFAYLVDGAMLSAGTVCLRRKPLLRIGVNVSVCSVEASCGALVAAVYDAMAVAERLVVEVTETAPIRDRKTMRTFISALQAAGVRVAFDDLGAGHFGLEDVREFSPDVVKLAGSLVSEWETRGAEVDRVVAQTHAVGGVVVAEMVDTEKKLDRCRDGGIDYVQGFLLGGLLQDLENVPGCVDEKPCGVGCWGEKRRTHQVA